MHNHKDRKKVATSAFIVAAKATHQVGAQTDLMTTGRNQGPHQGASRITKQVTQVKTVPSPKIRTHIYQARFDDEIQQAVFTNQ